VEIRDDDFTDLTDAGRALALALAHDELDD